jgi:hypothetical protein
MNDDFIKYESMRDGGNTAEQVFQAAKGDGMDTITLIRLVRKVFSLSSGEAKDVMLRAENIASSRDEYQGRIAERLENLFA